MARAYAVFCLLALCPLATAADYYVDAAATAGGNGSSGAPYKTIQQGLNIAQPGDAVNIRPGRYTLTSALTFPRSGTAIAPITVNGAAGGAVLVEAQPGLNISLIQTARSYITIQDITFDGNFSTANGLIRLDPGGSFQTFRRCEIRRQGNHLLRIDSNDLLVEDCHLHHAIWPASPSTDAHCTHSQTGFRHTFRRCDMHHATGDLWQGSRDSGAWGDIVFEYCDMHIELADDDCNGIAAGTPITENHFDTKVYSGTNTNLTVRYSMIRGSRLGRLGGPGGTDAAFNLKEAVVGFYIYGNLIYNNQWAFRLRYPSTGYHVYNNFIYDNDLAVRLEDGVANLTFLNNTFYKNTTLIQNVASGTPLTWQNNIFATASGTVWPGTFTNNLFWGVPSGAWQSLTGNRVANPLFVNATAFDLHLAEGSPAIDVGLTLTDVANDIDDDPRPVGTACDIGADEFRLAGDVTADGSVDVVDLLFFVDSFGWNLGDASYDPRCDFDRDGAVDVVDLLMLVDNFGK